MEFFKVIGVGVLGVVLANVMKEVKAEYTLYLILGTGMLVLTLAMDGLKEAVEAFYDIADKSGVAESTFSNIVKIVGIGYLTEYAASLCADGGAASIAKKIRLYGKIVIFITSIPLISELVKSLVKFGELI